MCVGIRSSVSWEAVSIFDTVARPSPICTLIILLKWQDFICPRHNTSFRSLSDSHVQVIGKIVLSAQLSELQVCVLFWCCGQSSLAVTRRNVVYWLLCHGWFSDGMLHSPYLISWNYFRIHVAVVSAGCITNWLRCWDQYWRRTRQKKQDAVVATCKVHPDSAEYRSVCISNKQQRPTYLNGSTYELVAKPNGHAGLRECKCPAACANIYTSGTFCEETNNSTWGYVNRVGTDLPHVIVRLTQAVINPTERRRQEEEKSVTETVAADAQIKESRDPRW